MPEEKQEIDWERQTQIYEAELSEVKQRLNIKKRQIIKLKIKLFCWKVFNWIIGRKIDEE